MTHLAFSLFFDVDDDGKENFFSNWKNEGKGIFDHEKVLDQ